MNRLFALLALIGMLSIACQPVSNNTAVPHPPPPQADSLLQVAFLIMEGVYNTELTAPMDIFHHTVFHSDSGMQVFTIAQSLAPVTTFEGLRILPDYSYTSPQVPRIDILVVPSAEHHLDTDLEDLEMLHFVQTTANQAQYILSLCDGAFVLAQAGLLDSVESTTFPGDIGAYRTRYPSLSVHEEVLFVHDGRFITSAGGATSFEPALYLAEILYGKVAADGIAKGMVIDWDLSKVPHLQVQSREVSLP